MILKTTIQNLQMLYSLILLYMTLVCQSYVVVCHPYVTRMWSGCNSYLLVCHQYVTRMSSVCHPYVLVWHPYVNRMSSACTHISSVCTRMSPVCQPYFTRLWFYHELCQNVSNEVFFTRAQISSEHSKPLWRLCLECGIVIHSQSTNKGLWTLYLAWAWY